MATRRDLIGVGAALATTALTGATAALAESGWPEFIQVMAKLHRNGRSVAVDARRAGMKLADLFSVILFAGADREEASFPKLLFHTADGEYRTFDPQGEL